MIDAGTWFGDERHLLVKLEGTNPTGSLKDRVCISILEDAYRSGLLDGRGLLEASSGNMACSVAYFGAVLGYDVTLIVGSKLTAEKEAFLRYFGARLIHHGTFTSEGAERCREMVAADRSQYFFLDQLANPAAPLAHMRTTGPEIVRDSPTVGTVVVSLGSGATALGVGRFLADAAPDVRLLGIEAAPGTRLPGTGAFLDGEVRGPFLHALADERLLWGTQHVDARMASGACRELTRFGVFCGLQTGGLAAAARLALEKDDCRDVLIVAGDTGWKNLTALDAFTATDF